KKKFVKEPGQMKLLIVVDKLLTGFDAPSATYLYIDKKMQDHSLFQAICRVNRLDGEDKDYGYIVDYKDLFRSLESSIHKYTSGAFDAYDSQDVEGLLSDRIEKAKERLEDAREKIKALCEIVEPPKDTMAYLRYFCAKDTMNKEELKKNEPQRVDLYRYTVSLVRAYANLANEMLEAGYTPKEIENIKQEVKDFEAIRQEVKLASGDYIDLKLYEPAMRHLIDTYINAEESKKISAFDDKTLIELIVEQGRNALNALPRDIAENEEAVAETIENNLRKVIIDKQPINPKYYESMSKLLDNLIKDRRTKALNYQNYLDKIIELANQAQNPSNSTKYPKILDTNAKRALYDNLGQDETLALELDRDIRKTKKDDWRGNKIKEREVKYAVKRHVPEADVDRIFDLAKNQRDY
ncbi:MAG: restriction endonuclease subunit R, partial [Planctomycetota bacterium]